MYYIFLIHCSKGWGAFRLFPGSGYDKQCCYEHSWAHVLVTQLRSFTYTPKSGITGSWGELFPNFLRNRHTVIQRGCTSLHSHQQCRSVPFTPQPLQHKLSSVFLIFAILLGVRWNLRVVLICISLMTNDVEHFLKCLSALWDSSVESSLFRSVLHFFIGLCVLLVSNFLSSLYILENRPLSDVGLVKIFSHYVGRLSFCLIDHVLCFTEAFPF